MILKKLIFILFFVSLSSAAACVQNTFENIMNTSMGTFLALAFAFTILVVVMAYILGTTFNEASFVVFYKDELFHLFFSAVLLASITGIMFFSCNVLSAFLDFVLQERGPDQTFFAINRAEGTKLSICYSGLESPQQVALCYFQKLETETRDLVKNSMKESIKNEMESTLVVSVTTPVTGSVSLPRTAYQRTWGVQHDMIYSTFAMPALISISMQRILISFSVDFAKFLLPAAFFLRILPITRTMGNFFIAVSLALYIVIPVFYALMGIMDEAVFTNCSQYTGVINDQVAGDCTKPTSFWLVARAIPQAFFLPNLMLALVVTFLSAINKALRVVT